MERITVTITDHKKYNEFPELVYLSSERNVLYFDANQLIHSKGDSSIHSVKFFRFKFQFWIEAVAVSYDIPPDNFFAIDEKTGHLLVDEALDLLFLAYLNPFLATHMLEKCSEMFGNGLVLSDSLLMAMARDRFSIEDLHSNM